MESGDMSSVIKKYEDQFDLEDIEFLYKNISNRFTDKSSYDLSSKQDFNPSSFS